MECAYQMVYTHHTRGEKARKYTRNVPFGTPGSRQSSLYYTLSLLARKIKVCSYLNTAVKDSVHTHTIEYLYVVAPDSAHTIVFAADYRYSLF